MGELLSPARLQRDSEAIARGEYLADPIEILRKALARFRPPSRISTVDCAEQFRKFRTTEGGALVPYDRWRTPYNIGAMDALDDPAVNLVVMVKPSRSGGTTVAENYLFKMMLFGPMGDVGWYLGSDDAVKAYVEKIVRPMFEDHPDLEKKLGTGKGDNTQAAKRVAGHMIEYLAAKDGNFRNREFVYGIMDEPDGWSKYSESAETQLYGRQKNVGNRRKGIILSHPDKGWKAGTAAAWMTSSRGIYVMRCAECQSFAAAHATKYWPDVPQFTLWWAKDEVDFKTGEIVRPRERLDLDERVALAERTAGVKCPHCGSVLDEKQRHAMIDEAGREGWWMHRGQTLDADEGIIGDRDPTHKLGFWVHGIMVKTSPAGELAKAVEEALTKYERSGGSRVATKAVREVMSKQLCEIFEGKSDIEGLTAAAVQKRSRKGLPRGLFPKGALFITAAVDVGSKKFDVSFRAWDEEGRSWWLDRLTIRQTPDAEGRLRDIATRERVEDWESALIDDVILRTFPIEGRDDAEMPVAQVVVDVSDGNVTWIGREFAARCYKRGLVWGAKARWPRVQLIQGSPTRTAPELPPNPRYADPSGKRFPVGVWEWSLGVHRLKELVLERLAISDGGPGQCYFAQGIGRHYFDEYFNEPLVDGKFERQGPNESFDLFGYEEAARLMLKPDRADIDWQNEHKRPVWARPISLQPEGGDPAVAADDVAAKPKPKPKTKKQSALQRFNALNQGGR